MFSFDVVDSYVGDDARIVTYDREALHAWEKEQFYNDGIEDGTRQGIEQKEKELIINMKEKGLSLEMISKISKLPINKIKEIINNQTQKK